MAWTPAITIPSPLPPQKSQGREPRGLTLEPSQPPAELADGFQARALRRDQAGVPLNRDPALRPHRIHHHRRPRLGRHVAKLDPVYIELERALIVDRVHDWSDLRPPRWADRGKASDPL